MANEALAWAAPPTVTDAVDGSQCYNLGVAFTVSGAVNAEGCQWRVPDTLAAGAGGGVYAVAIWNADTSARIAYKEFTPVAGGYQSVAFDAPVALSAGVNYVATTYTNHYTYTATNPSGTTTPSGKGTATGGRLASYNGGAAGAPIPTGTANTTFYISPLLAVTSGATGTMTAALPVLASSSAGVVKQGAALTAALPVLAAALAGAVSTTGAVTAPLPTLSAASAGIVSTTGAVGAPLPTLSASAAGTVSTTAAIGAALPGLAVSIVSAEGPLGSITVALPRLAATLIGNAPAAGIIAAALPRLAVTMRGASDAPAPTGLVGVYRELVAELVAALRDAGAPLRVVTDLADPVGRRDVVLGPPTFLWEGFCSPTQPSGCNIDVYLIENLEKRAVDRLLENLPTLLTAVAQLGEESIVLGCAPGAFPSGTTDLPCYQITAEITF